VNYKQAKIMEVLAKRELLNDREIALVATAFESDDQRNIKEWEDRQRTHRLVNSVLNYREKLQSMADAMNVLSQASTDDRYISTLEGLRAAGLVFVHDVIDPMVEDFSELDLGEEEDDVVE